MISQYLYIPTVKCNLRCEYCYTKPHKDLYSGIENNFDPVETLKLLLEKADSYGPGYRITFHGGEPTILGKEKLYEMCELISKSKSSGISIQTNLYDIGEWFIDWAKKFNVSVGCSYDGVSSLRGDGSVVRDNIVKLRDSGVRIGMIVSITPVSDLDSLIDDIIDLKIGFQARPPNTGLFSKKELASAMLKFWFKGIDKFMEANLKDEWLSWSFMSLVNKPNACCTFKKCVTDSSIVAVHSSGHVWPCNRMPYFCIGNIYDNSLEDIEYSPVRIELYNRYNHLKKYTHCGNCVAWEFCYGGCIGDVPFPYKHVPPDSCFFMQVTYSFITMLMASRKDVVDFYVGGRR